MGFEDLLLTGRRKGVVTGFGANSIAADLLAELREQVRGCASYLSSTCSQPSQTRGGCVAVPSG
jgi:hypothetical protein